ncbi:MAG: NAD-dependent epimerase/dehydratase family protein [Alcanivoracaceae bacterium]|nr:NAD-dependent epimerase/dehydratase family protein [Alcanivoracaceae bacterium]
MKCLVTGANGFLGTNLVRELVTEGWQVRASGRQPSLTPWLSDLPVEYAPADITNAEAVSAAVSGCDVVFHVAGDTSFWKRLYPRQRAANVDGTVNVARACLSHGIRRMVHTSTADVFGYDPAGGTVDEHHGFNYTGMDYHYGETKREADRQLRAVMAEGLDAVLVHPGSIIGPWDHTLQFGRLFFELKQGKVPASPPGGASFCHAREVARAHIRAADVGEPGQSYLLAGNDANNVPHAALMALMAQAVGASPPRWTLPEWLFVAYAWGCEQVSGITGKAPQINPGQARYMSRPQYCDSSKAQAALDYRVPDLSTCVEDALAWYRNHGFDI